MNIYFNNGSWIMLLAANPISDAANSITNSISEYFDNLMQKVLKDMYDNMYVKCESSFNGIFDTLNDMMGKSTNILKSSPESYNSAAFGTVKNISDSAFLPIAAMFATVVFCWELVHLVQESNNMQSITPQKVFLPLMKLCLCLVVCSKAFDIIMAFFEVGGRVTTAITGSTPTFGAGVSFSGLAPATLSTYSFGDVMDLVGYLLVINAVKISILAIAVLIYCRCIMWFMEIYVTASAAAIPYSTWMNKEWSQVGMNYTRKMLALAFQGPFMLLLFAIYGNIVSSAFVASGDFLNGMFMVLGSAIVLVMLLFKTGSISESIFAAH